MPIPVKDTRPTFTIACEVNPDIYTWLNDLSAQHNALTEAGRGDLEWLLPHILEDYKASHPSAKAPKKSEKHELKPAEKQKKIKAVAA